MEREKVNVGTIDVTEFTSELCLNSIYSDDETKSDIVSLLLMPYICKEDISFYDYCLNAHEFKSGFLVYKVSHIIKCENEYYNGAFNHKNDNKVLLGIKAKYIPENKNEDIKEVRSKLESNLNIFANTIYNILPENILAIHIEEERRNLYDMGILYLISDDIIYSTVNKINKCEYYDIDKRYALRVHDFYNLLYAYNSIIKETNMPQLSERLSTTIKLMTEVVNKVNISVDVDYIKRLYLITSTLSKNKYPPKKGEVNLYKYLTDPGNQFDKDKYNAKWIIGNYINEQLTKEINVYNEDLDIVDSLIHSSNINIFERIKEFNSVEFTREILESIEFFKIEFQRFKTEGEKTTEKYLTL
jgi:hypothetical protein